MKLIVAGNGTAVGKTIVSAILATLFEGDYWKPIQSGEPSDTTTMKQWLKADQIHPSAYSWKAPLSPHHAARLENSSIDLSSISLPQTTRPLIIESVGGVYVPLTAHTLSIDLFKAWDSPWVVVSKHYLGSINHTLLTLDALKQHNIFVAGLIFNGLPQPDSEAPILNTSGLPLLGRLLPETHLDQTTIRRYANAWTPLFGTLLPKCKQQIPPFSFKEVKASISTAQMGAAI